MKVIIVAEIHDESALMDLVKDREPDLQNLGYAVHEDIYIHTVGLDNINVILPDEISSNDQTLGNQIRKLML